MMNIVPRIASFMKGKEEIETDAVQAEALEVRRSTKVQIDSQFEALLALMDQTLVEVAQMTPTANEDEQTK